MIDMKNWKSCIEKWKILFYSDFFIWIIINSKLCDIKNEWFDMFFFLNEMNNVVECEKIWCYLTNKV